MNIIKSIREHFDEKGIVKGTQEIIDTAAAAVLVSAVAYIAVKQIRMHMITRNAKNRTMDAPIDAARGYGSASAMLRDAKRTHKQIAKQLKEVEKEAIDRLSVGRNRMFNELGYAERRSILEGEGVDVQAVEREIQMEKKLRKERAKIMEEQQKAQNSFFNRIRRLLPSTSRTVGGYSIPRSDLRRTNAGIVYNAVARAAWQNRKNQSPTAAVPNRFIIKPTGEIIPDTYQDKQARTKAVDKYIASPKNLPAIPNKFNKLKLLSPDIQKAYLEMRGEVARVCGARLNPFEQETHSKLSLKDRALALENAWKSHKYLMTDPQQPWYGDQMAADQGRGINSPDNGEKMGQEMDGILSFLEKNGINPNSLTGEAPADAVDAVLYNFQTADIAKGMRRAAKSQAYTTDQILQTGGVVPKDIPFFDQELYDTDLDPFMGTPTRPMIRIPHESLTVDSFNTEEPSLDPGFVPEEVRKPQSKGKSPTHWRFRSDHQTDFSRTPYTNLHRSIQKGMKTPKASATQVAWRQSHSSPRIGQMTHTLEEVEYKMNPTRPTPRPGRRDRAHMDILMDKDLEVIESFDSGKKKKKKGKKKEKIDYFSEFDFSGPDKKHKKKKKSSKKKDKKAKDKKKKSKPEAFMSAYDDDDDRPVGMNLTESILRGVGDATRKRFSKAIKASKEGKLYSK